MTKTSLSYRVAELPPARRGNPQLPRPGLVEAQHLRLARSRCDKSPLADRGAQSADRRSTLVTGYLAFCLARAVDERRSCS
jgi:hypothetical protein